MRGGGEGGGEGGTIREVSRKAEMCSAWMATQLVCLSLWAHACPWRGQRRGRALWKGQVWPGVVNTGNGQTHL